MLKLFAVALVLALIGCGTSASSDGAGRGRIEPDSTRASHCFAAHNFWVSLAEKQGKLSSLSYPQSLKQNFDSGVRAIWQQNRFTSLASRQDEELEAVALTEQMLQEPSSAVHLARSCSLLEDRNVRFQHDRVLIAKKLLTQKRTGPIF